MCVRFFSLFSFIDSYSRSVRIKFVFGFEILYRSILQVREMFFEENKKKKKKNERDETR